MPGPRAATSPTPSAVESRRSLTSSIPWASHAPPPRPKARTSSPTPAPLARSAASTDDAARSPDCSPATTKSSLIDLLCLARALFPPGRTPQHLGDGLGVPCTPRAEAAPGRDVLYLHPPRLGEVFHAVAGEHHLLVDPAGRRLAL